MGELMTDAHIERFLSDVRERAAMKEPGHIDSEALMLEATRYLAAVDAFRTESCEPMWLPELVSIRASESQAAIPATSSVSSGKHLH